MTTSILSQAKNMFIMFCCMASMTAVRAQSPFTISPSDVITSTIACDSHEDLHFYITNPNTYKISVGWKIKSSTLPMARDWDGNGCWDYQLCDWDLCYTQIATGSQYFPSTLPADTIVNIKLSPYPWQNKGSGTLVVEVFEKNFPSNSKTITWNVTGCSTGSVCATGAGISENTRNTDFMVYPNPAREFVNVEITAGYSHSGSIQVYNLVGEKLTELNGIKNSIQKIDLQELPAGAYFVKYSNGEGAAVKKIFKTE